MQIDEALAVVEQYKEDWELPGLLETLKQMQDCYEDLPGQQKLAYRVVFREMQKLFLPA